MSMEIHMTKAGIGDCIHISMGKNSKKLNLLIDSGKNPQGFSESIEYIKNNKEKLDYMLITHDDDDHIMGIFENIVNKKADDLGIENIYKLFYDKHVMMNYWKKGTETLFDYKKVEKIGEELNKKDINLEQLEYVVADPIINDGGEEEIGFNLFQILWKNDKNEKIITNIKKYTKIDEIKSIATEKDWEHAELIILSPTRESLKRYMEFVWKERINLRTKKSEVMLSVHDNEKSISDDEWKYSIQKLYNNPFDLKKNESLSNNSSISFLLCYNGTLSLFAGDSNPKDMINTASRYLNIFCDGMNKIPIDFMKIPHHASSYNNPLEFIEKFPTKNYLISTKGHNRYKHPGKQTLANIAKTHINDEEVNIYCNYPVWKSSNIRFRDKEISWKVDDDICTITGNNDRKVQLKFYELTKEKRTIKSSTSEKIEISL